MSVKTLYNDIIKIIELLLEDEVQGKKEFERWQMEGGQPDKKVQDGWHYISHFLADQDIRIKDKEYDVYMKLRMKEILGDFRALIEEEEY